MAGIRIRCSRCNHEFEGTVCPFCGQAVAVSGAAYTDAAPPPPKPKKRAWVGLALTAIMVAMLVACRALTHGL